MLLFVSTLVCQHTRELSVCVSFLITSYFLISGSCVTWKRPLVGMFEFVTAPPLSWIFSTKEPQPMKQPCR